MQVLLTFVCFVCSGPDLDAEDEDAENQAVNGSSGDGKTKSLQQKTGEALLRHILNSDCVEGSSYSFRHAGRHFALNHLEFKGNYNAISNNMKSVHGPLMAGGCYIWYMAFISREVFGLK